MKNKKRIIKWEGKNITSKLIKALSKNPELINGKWSIVDIYEMLNWDADIFLPCVGVAHPKTAEIKFFCLLDLLPELREKV